MTDVPSKPPSRKGLYAPFIVLLVALAAWTGWWFYLTRQIDAGLEAQAANLRQQGWDIRYADKTIVGWPFRANVKLTHVTLAAPSGHALSAPELNAEANAYQPTKWVVVAPKGLILTRAGKGKVAVNGDAIRMSASGIDQRWPNLALELVNPIFTVHPGGEPFPIARASRIEFYSRPHLEGSETPTDDIDVMFRLVDGQGRRDGPVEGFAQDGQLTTQLEATIGRAGLLKLGDAAGVFSQWSKGGGTFRNIRGDLQAGDSRATLSSDILRADADGRLTGQVALQSQKPLPALSGLLQSRQGPANQIGAVGVAAAAGAAEAATREEVALTLNFRDGRTWLGPFSLAPAPKLF
ncbi:DUF2125 domain-containing protein [uncultured Brevundimonas sp.]|uniref:DUF2125 domain-containing protein n=1 Tax=uncultured Brevundimonas sp. TaxID=213418 RepID=UPI002637D7E4|nr:DUF2125 domain-containing protein [uncultured Brevundimonas sp.]